MNKNNKGLLITSLALGIIAVVIAVAAWYMRAAAFTGPTGVGGVGNGAISVTAGGNVGIGTAAAGQKLEVVGNVSSSGMCLGGTCSATWPSSGLSGAGTTGYHLKYTGASTVGNSLIYDNGTNVGVGTSTPSYKLDVVSGGATTARFGTASTDVLVVGGGSGKITAGTYDPPYTINGEKFATYVPGMTGQKEETTGIVYLAQASDGMWSTTINFNSLMKGSDLWLFAQATNLKKQVGNMAVLLTAGFDGTVWYHVDPTAMTLTIYGRPTGNGSDLSVSYRLTAPRFDSASWPNTREDEASGFIINN